MVPLVITKKKKLSSTTWTARLRGYSPCLALQELKQAAMFTAWHFRKVNREQSQIATAVIHARKVRLVFIRTDIGDPSWGGH